MKASNKIGLVLSGGGARSAYQAGALLGLHDLLANEGEEKLAFQIISGISGGALNGSYLAARADEGREPFQDLWNYWSEIKTEYVIDTSNIQMYGSATRLLFQLGSGGMGNANPITQMLNTKPLINYLLKKIHFSKIRQHINSGILHGVALTSTHYGTGSSVTFFDGESSIQNWTRSYRVGIRTNIAMKHLLASSAIPLLFPPIKIQGAFYGDGGVRMTSPLSPAIHMGADKIIAIGVRYHRTPIETLKMNSSSKMASIQLADILGVFLNSMFMASLDSDLERMNRINQTLDLLTKEDRLEHPEKLRKIPILAIRPSMDLGQLAVGEIKRLPWILRHFLKGLGASAHHGSELISYLAFEKSYTTQLLQLGLNDVMADKARILEWFKKNP